MLGKIITLIQGTYFIHPATTLIDVNVHVIAAGYVFVCISESMVALLSRDWDDFSEYHQNSILKKPILITSYVIETLFMA